MADVNFLHSSLAGLLNALVQHNYSKMTDTMPEVSFPGSTPPSSAAEQARIRRERREAKIKAGGASRLNKITGLGGGLQRGSFALVQAILAFKFHL